MDILKDYKNPSIFIPLFGLAFWTGALYFMVMDNREDIAKNGTEIRQLQRDRSEMNNRMGNIEGKLDTVILLLESRTK